jgi:hypothetical protein
MALPPILAAPKGYKRGKRVSHRSSFSAPSQRPRATGRVYVTPTPRPRAAPQAAYYASQGRSVEHQANRQAARQKTRAARAQGAYYASQGRSVARRAYLAKPLAQRKKIVRQYKAQEARGEGTPETRHVLKIHNARVARGKVRERSARAQRAEKVSEGRAVEKVARQQRTTARLAAPGRYYASLGKDVEKTANEQQAKNKDVIFSKDPKVLKAAGFHEAGVADKLMALPTAAAGNAPADFADLVVTTPTSLGKLASTAATHPEKVPGMLAAPYKEAFKDPIGFATKRPVTSYLMFAPGVKTPGLAAGRVARLAGKQTLERPAATLPGTTLRQQRVGSRDVVKRAKQAREDKRAPKPTIQHKEIQRRVDEFYDASKYHIAHVVAKEAKRAKAKAKQLPKAQRAEHIETHVSGARQGAHQEIDRRFGREFGSHWQASDRGVVLKPKHAAEGHLHESRANAELVAKRVPFDATVRAAGDKFAVVPKVAHERLGKHATVGTSPAVYAKVLRTSSRMFRGAALPFSLKWLGGQVGEAALRSALKGAGPASLWRVRKIVNEMERQHPGSGKALLARAAEGGHFGEGNVLRADLGRTLGEEFADSPALARPAAIATKAGRAPVIKQARQMVNLHRSAVFNGINRYVELTAQKAILGKAIKQSPLMEKRVIGLGKKAYDDAAKGLHATEAQVELGRAVNRAYGKYSKFSPEARQMLLHNTPFAPWYVNTGKFLLNVLPRDHPVTTALLADLDKTTEEWRVANRLSFHSKKRAPGFLMGTYPLSKERHMPLGHYLPFSPAEPSDAIGGLLVPQFRGVQQALAPGVTWKGDPIRTEGGRWREAGVSGVETFVPGASTVGGVTGLSDLARGDKKKAKEVRKRGVAKNLLHRSNPLAPIPAGGKKKGSKRKAAPRLSGAGGRPKGLPSLSGGGGRPKGLPKLGG